MATIELALPTSYDARDYGFVTTPKDQGNCGSCWAFASAGALESHLLKAGMVVQDPDLSEQQQVSCNTAMLGCYGGSSTALLYWESKGPLDEAYFPYTAYDTTPCVEEDQLGYSVADYHTVPVTTAAFKDSLYNNGPSYWRYTVHSDFFTFWNYSNFGTVYVNGAKALEGGHAVLLIGWDDGKNAFLCKNSWGETGGPNDDGTFWIAYDGHEIDLAFGMANFTVISPTCSSSEDCSDGLACNGLETCDNNGVCQPGIPVSCPDDELYCNGSEFCDEATGDCNRTNPPCDSGEICMEEIDLCVPETCNDGTCDEGEDCINCSWDCISGLSSGDCASCFKGVCDGVCHPVKEGPECSDCSPAYCCGDGVCNGEENSEKCAIDCGESPTTETNCSDEIDNDGDNLTDCDDPDCFGDPVCSDCLPRKAACNSNYDCCSGRCFRDFCK